MQIEILGAESMGVRSLATFVRAGEHAFLIDPGVSLAPMRHAHPPHPLELAALLEVREAIQRRAEEADAIVVSHYHHDHYTAFEERALDAADAAAARALYAGRPLFAKHPRLQINGSQRRRAEALWAEAGLKIQPAEGAHWHALEIGRAAPHGTRESKQGFVAMSALREGNELFVHASDIQLLDAGTVARLIDLEPTVLLVSGPPLYHPAVTDAERSLGLKHLAQLARALPEVIVDHHFLRSQRFREDGERAFAAAEKAGHRLHTAAERMGLPTQPLEDRRPALWEERRYPKDFVERWLAGEEEARAEVERLRGERRAAAQAARRP
ncbi:MAG: MBL fold metallo-hydrolase [Planctomycetes bacterium]|nr:MBL fold metallo-hydrolase [Planctomycetota bacterium]